MSVHPLGLVRVEHTLTCDAVPTDLLARLNRLNGEDMADDDTNLDLEPFTTASTEGERVSFSFATMLAALGTEAYSAAMRELERAAHDSGLLPPPGPHEPVYRLLERTLYRELGPVTRELFARLPAADGRVRLDPAFEAKAHDLPAGGPVESGGSGAGLGDLFGFFAKPIARLETRTTPWGELPLLLEIDDAELGGEQRVHIALVPREAPHTDLCAVAGIRGAEARLLAAELATFAETLARGTTGFDRAR